MNVIIDNLPYEIDGHPIMPDFRNMIRLELLLKEDIWSTHKTLLALGLLYNPIPKDINKAVNGLVWFYSRGKEPEQIEGEVEEKPEAYDFDVDADDIYSAFFATYHLNLSRLNVNDLHWWEFCALMRGLPDDTIIKEKMYYRTVDISKIKDKKEKTRVQAMKHQYKIDKIDRSKIKSEEDIEASTFAYYDARVKAAKKRV